jgi:hypothetical protein
LSSAALLGKANSTTAAAVSAAIQLREVFIEASSGEWGRNRDASALIKLRAIHGTWRPPAKTAGCCRSTLTFVHLRRARGTRRLDAGTVLQRSRAMWPVRGRSAILEAVLQKHAALR